MLNAVVPPGLAAVLPAPLAAPYCVAALLLLAFIPHWIRAFVYVRPKLAREGRAFDLRYTRKNVEAATDDTPEGRTIARLTGAHTNSLEAFSFIAASVVLALLSGVERSTVDALATAFLAIRVAYTVVYCTGTRAWMGPARSLLWAVGLCICFTLLLKAGAAYSAAGHSSSSGAAAVDDPVAGPVASVVSSTSAASPAPGADASAAGALRSLSLFVLVGALWGCTNPFMGQGA